MSEEIRASVGGPVLYEVEVRGREGELRSGGDPVGRFELGPGHARLTLEGGEVVLAAACSGGARVWSRAGSRRVTRRGATAVVGGVLRVGPDDDALFLVTAALAAHAAG